jgi:hypothetical protein
MRCENLLLRRIDTIAIVAWLFRGWQAGEMPRAGVTSADRLFMIGIP